MQPDTSGLQLFASDLFQVANVGFEHIPVEHQIGKLAPAHDPDKSSHFQLFHVMRKGGRSHRLAFANIRARNAAPPGAYLLQDLVASWIRQSLCDQPDLHV